MRILVVRTSALGDVVHCLPAVAALARHFPDARIGWVVEAVFAPLLEHHPDIDELIPARLKPWRRRPAARSTWREVAAFVRRLRAFRADVALDLMGNHKGGILGALSGARRRIGLARTDRREPSSVLWDTETARAQGTHAVDRALSVLAPLGIPYDPEQAAADLGGQHLFPDAAPARREDDGATCLIHPGAAWGNKVYPADRWAAVARGLRDATGLTPLVALSPSPEERAMAERVVELADGAARTVEASDLRSLAALSRQALLVLGGDTGPTHLAHALGTPVLCLMGPTDPTRHGPYAHPERTLARRLPCSYCYQRLDAPKACLLALRPGDVVERASAILLDSPPANSAGVAAPGHDGQSPTSRADGHRQAQSDS